MTSIRPFEPADIPAVVILEEAYQPQPWTPGIFAGELATGSRSYVVAEHDSIVGYGGVMMVGEEAHLTNLLVHPDHRRKGLGSQMVRRLIETSLVRGAKHLTLEVRSDNTGAIRLYQSFGLDPIGVRPCYYRGGDALIMWARDIDQRGDQIE